MGCNKELPTHSFFHNLDNIYPGNLWRDYRGHDLTLDISKLKAGIV